MPDVVHAAAAVRIIGLLDERAADVCGLRAGKVRLFCVAVFAEERFAVLDLVAAAGRDVVGGFHERVDCVVNGFYAVGVVDGEFGVVGGLDFLVDDAVYDAEGVHLEGDAGGGAVLDGEVLLVEVVVEGGAVVAAVAFGPEVEGEVLDVGVELGGEVKEGLEDVPGADGGGFGGVGLVGVDEGVAAVFVGFGGLVGESDPDGLGEIEHVGLFVPGVRV